MGLSDIPDYISQFLEWNENPIIATITLTIMTFLILLASNSLGQMVIVAIITFFIGGFIYDLTIKGGDGWAKIPLLGDLFQSKGHALIAFYIGIILSAGISIYIADFVYLNFIQSNITTIEGKFGISLGFAIITTVAFELAHFS